MNIMRVKIEGRKDKPLYGRYRESYSKKLPDPMKTKDISDELIEIRKRYLKIHRIEFIIEVVEEPIPCKGEIDPELVREAEETARKKREKRWKEERKEREQNAHKS